MVDIDQYMKQVGLEEIKDKKIFWEKLSTKYPENMIKPLKEIVENRKVEQGTKDNLYEAKNINLDLSIDFANFSFDLYKKFFYWLSSKVIAAKKILDVGCDNGIVTCFLASLYPDAQVVGIDSSSGGIACARELAKKLQLNNITFNLGRIEESKEVLAQGSFDLITSLRNFHEIEQFPNFKYWHEKDLIGYLEKTFKLKSLQTVVSLLSTQGNFISCERLATLPDYIWWVEKLREAGLFLKWQEKGELLFHELAEEQVMPVFVASKTPTEPVSFKEILKFYANEEKIDKNQKEFFDAQAELVFDTLKGKELICGIQIDYSDGQGDLRLEIWKKQQEAMYYQYSNVGFRQLNIFPLSFNLRLKKELNAIKKQMQTTENKVYYYEKISQRNKL